MQCAQRRGIKENVRRTDGFLDVHLPFEFIGVTLLGAYSKDIRKMWNSVGQQQFVQFGRRCLKHSYRVIRLYNRSLKSFDRMYFLLGRSCSMYRRTRGLLDCATPVLVPWLRAENYPRYARANSFCTVHHVRKNEKKKNNKLSTRPDIR